MRGNPVPAASLTIRRAALDVIRKHAADDLPNECCGLLIGSAGSVERALRARNLRPSPNRYLIDPADHCAALRTARASGLEVVGVYHSHPTGSLRPSAVDRQEASYPEFVYLIVSPRATVDGTASLAAYRLTAHGFEEIAVQIVTQKSTPHNTP